MSILDLIMKFIHFQDQTTQHTTNTNNSNETNSFENMESNKSLVYSLLINISKICKPNCIGSIGNQLRFSTHWNAFYSIKNVIFFVSVDKFRAQLFQDIWFFIGSIRRLWSTRLDRSSFISSSIYSIWHVNLCAILRFTIYHFHGVCDCNGYHDIHWICYHRRSVMFNIRICLPI